MSEERHLPEGETSAPPYALEMVGIRKEFPGVVALDGVDLRVRPGEIHALVGENGAGKSSLMKILAGAYRRDAGDVMIDGVSRNLSSPRDAQAVGVGMVFQELTLLPELSAAENIFVGALPTGGLGFVSRREMRAAAARLLDELGAPFDPDTQARDLSVGQRQLVEIAKVYSHHPKILVLDEPTSALTPHETGLLFTVLRRLKANGLATIFISHRLQEVTELADRVTVMRDGRVVASRPIEEIQPREIVRLMVGRSLAETFPKAETTIGQPVLEVRGLTRHGVFRDVSFTVRSGEVVGLAGLVGAGRTEVARSIFGLDEFDEGEILIDGVPVRIRSPRDAIRRGVGFIPEDRKVDGLVLESSVQTNITLTILSRLALRGFIRRSAQRSTASALIERLSIRPPDPSKTVSELSGGNQQKIVIGRWAEARRVLILDEPTRGVDVGAKREIHTLIGELASQGTAILMISSELPELLAVTDQVVVLHEGEVTADLPRALATEEAVMLAATGHRDGIA